MSSKSEHDKAAVQRVKNREAQKRWYKENSVKLLEKRKKAGTHKNWVKKNKNHVRVYQRNWQRRKKQRKKMSQFLIEAGRIIEDEKFRKKVRMLKENYVK